MHVRLSVKWITIATLCLAGSPSHAGTLYEDLGGRAGIDRLTAAYVEILAADPITGASFSGSNLDRIQRHLGDQFCELGGGPCRYGSDDMRTVHANLCITEAQFHVAVQHLRSLMTELGYPLGVRNRLLALLAPMKRDIVGVTVAAPTPIPADGS